MSTSSDPIIKIYDPEDQTRFWDISTIVGSVNIAYGRNQPFAVQEITADRAQFNSVQSFWSTIDTAPTDGQGNVELPSRYLVDGRSPITIEAYGSSYDMFVERHETPTDSKYITFLCYNKAYKLKSAITLNSLSEMVFHNSKVYFRYDTNYINPLSDTISQNGYYEATCVLGGTDQVNFHIYIQDVTQSNVDVQYMYGTGSNIFRFIQIYGAGYTYEQCVCDNGYTYNYGATLQSSYTSQYIESVKENNDIAEDTAGEIIKLRVHSDSNYCWDALKSIGALSNRWPFFYDYAYFADYNTQSTTSTSNMNKCQYMHLDYGVDEHGLSSSYLQATQQGDKRYIDLYGVVANADQGSTYVQTSQKVYQENYSAKINISDIQDNQTGYEMYFPYPESDPTDVSVTDNTERNRLTKKIAFNRIVANYKPSDAVQFNISEIDSSYDSISPIGRFSSYQDLPATQTQGDFALVLNHGIMYDYYRYSGTQWEEYSLQQYQNDRNEIFPPYSLIEEIEDVQNGITIRNAPLAYTQLSWPSCLTQLTFGNPEFMDAQQQWSALTLEAQVSTEKGTEDSLISDRYASKLVIGNQTMQNLQDNREGFTGLIMEKNWDNELYRLSGYNDGVLQAYFNSQGEIMSGNEKVVINQDGITIQEGGGFIDPSLAGGIPVWDSFKDYVVDDIVQWNGKIYSCVVQNSNIEPGTTGANQYWNTSGNISLWSITDVYNIGDYVIFDGKVFECIQYTGGTHFSPTSSEGQAYWSCTVDTSDLSGDINATSNPVYGGTPNASGRVIINNEGLATYTSDGNKVCYVGTDGNIYGINISANQITSGTIDQARINQSSLSSQTIEANQITVNNGKITASQIDTDSLTIRQTLNPWSRYHGTYYVGDTVTYQNSTDTNGLVLYFRCTSQHTASNTRRPKGASLSASYWDEISQANSQQTTTPHVVINSEGLKTYDENSDVQCEVSTSGAITAGQGQIELNRNGFFAKYNGYPYLEIDSGGVYMFNYGTPQPGGVQSGEYLFLDSNANVTQRIRGAYHGTSSGNIPMLQLQQRSSNTGTYIDLKQMGSDSSLVYPSCQVIIQPKYEPQLYIYSETTQLPYFVGKLLGYKCDILDKFAGRYPEESDGSGSNTIYSGYIELSNGMIINWGIGTSTAGQNTQVSFQKRFTTRALYASCTTIRTDSGWGGFNHVSGNGSTAERVGTTGMYCLHDSGAGFYWIAIGY